VAAGTLIEIEVGEALDSSRHKRGDNFAISLHAPVTVGDALIIPAGTPGVGEVVHAERARGGGKPGELILAARYLELGGRRIPLRGMKLGAVGLDKTQKAMAIGMIPVVGLFSFVRGGETQIPQGTLASAKLVDAFVLDGTPAAAGTPVIAAAGAPGAVQSESAPAKDAPDVPSDHTTNQE
jgi:hypothetical protein